MNPRIQKITDEIERLKRKITNNQARLRDLERQKVELENADIVAAVRSIDVPPEDLSAFIQKLQSRAIPDLETEQQPQEGHFFEEE